MMVVSEIVILYISKIHEMFKPLISASLAHNQVFFVTGKVAIKNDYC